jgi:colanic acid biosynthesis glycosyl transferase WcaI
VTARRYRPTMARRPHLLVLNEYYWPGVEATAHLLTELCEALADDYDITVVTGALSGAAPGVEYRHGVRIVRVPSTSYARSRLSRRALNYLSYTFLAVQRSLREHSPDVVLCMTDPPFLGTAAYALARRFRAPLVVVSQDVFPEVAVQLGRLENAAAVAVLRTLVNFYLRHADRVVAIGETMRARLEAKGAVADRVRVIPNWVDISAINPRPKDNAWSRAHGVADKFVVMHSGNVGHAQDLDTLIRATTLLRDLDDLRVLIVGNGARREELGELTERLEADKVEFLPYQPRENLSMSLSSAEIHVVGLARGLSGFVVPSRLYGVLAAGRPVIVAADDSTETAAVVTEADCGIAVPPGRVDELAAVIRAAYDGKYDLDAMGRRAREYAEVAASRETAVSRYREVLAEVAGMT